MKKILKTIFLFFTMMCTFYTVQAQDTDIKVCLNGRILTFDVQPVIQDGWTMVPMREICTRIGMTVDWNDVNKEITIKSQYDLGKFDIVKMNIGSNIVSKNGDTFKIDAAPIIIDGRTLLPLRGVADSFNIDVRWEEKLRTAVLTADNIETITGYYNVPDFQQVLDTKVSMSNFSENGTDYYKYSLEKDNDIETLKNKYIELLKSRGYSRYAEKEYNGNIELYHNEEYNDSIICLVVDDKDGYYYIGVVVDKLIQMFSDTKVVNCPLSDKQSFLDKGYTEEFPYQNKEFWINKRTLSNYFKNEFSLTTWNKVTITGYESKNEPSYNIFDLYVDYDGKTRKIDIFKLGTQYVTDEISGLVRDTNPQTEFGFTDEQWDIIQKGVIITGVPKEYVILILGLPDKTKSSSTSTTYMYKDGYDYDFYYFDNNGILYEYLL